MEKEYVTFCGSFYYRCRDQFLYGYYIILLVTIYHQIIEILHINFFHSRMTIHPIPSYLPQTTRYRPNSERDYASSAQKDLVESQRNKGGIG